MSRKKWSDSRKNVEYKGCYPDYAYLHEEYQDPKYYRVPKPIGSRNKSTKEITYFQDDFIPKVIDPRLPPPRKYTDYLDGPTRIIPSITKVLRKQDESKSLDQALKRCYDLARSKQRRYFALQNGGKLCMATNSPDFMKWGKLPDGECKACKHRCPSGKKPCGKKCVDHDRQCKLTQHSVCEHDQYETGTKGGGHFTNSVFEIKDMNRDDVDDIPPEKDVFSRFRYATPDITDEMSCPTVPNNFFDLSPTQLFMQQYFNIDLPIKGMLIYKSAGAGKTCEALNVIGNFMGKWRIFWVTRQSLRQTPLENLYQDICQVRLRDIIESKDPITRSTGEVLASTKAEKIAFIRSSNGPAIMKRYGIEIEKQRILSYDNLVRMIVGKGGEGKKLFDQQAERTGDIGYQTLFVFDEAHNLISPGLPQDERQELDATFEDVRIGKRTYKSKHELYGNKDRSPLQGRDVIAAMLWESYKQSGKNSAKCLLLTGTPMSTSPVEMFWLLNLTLDAEKQRLSLDMNDYYDRATMKLKDEAILKFAKAAHGRISYLDITQNPTTFARKIFFDRMDVTLHEFHQKIIDDAVEHEKKTSNDWTKIVALYQNLGIMARTKGSFYDSETLKKYERDLKRMAKWDPEEEKKFQSDYYTKNVEKARQVFKLDIREKDRKEYAKQKPTVDIKTWLTSRKTRKTKKKFTKEEEKYLKFLMQDPASGTMRIKTMDEFVQVLDPVPRLEGKETRKNVSLLMWHKNFDPSVARELIPYYAPRIHECIQVILQREEQAMKELGHGLKHTVFTFSTASKDFSMYGSRAVASAFHAYQDLFRVLLVYKLNDDGQFVLHHDIPSNGPNDRRWGVAILSSKDLPNIYLDKHGGNQKVEYNPKIVGATQQAFNDAKNRYGDRIKVLIMDGAYTEGVEAYDDSIGHFLNEGLSPPQLEQASSRSVRFCRSKNIPFFKHVGGFMEMYFYTQKGMNEQMLQHVPYEEQLNINMLDVFKDLAAQFSIDYWLNINVNDFRPVYKGTIVDYYDKWNRAYIVRKQLDISDKNDASKHIKKVDYRFIVDPESMLTQITVGSKVMEISGSRFGVVTKWDHEQKAYRVKFDDQKEEVVVPTHELRLVPGETVDFQIPYGTDLAKKVMNIGNYNVMHPSNFTQDSVGDIRLPENALSVVSTAFRNSVLHVLLGIVSMLRMVVKAGNTGLPIHIVLPPPDSGDSLPAMSNFSARWTFQSVSDERTLKFHAIPMKQFLAPTKGISILFMTLQQTRDDVSENDHMNLLIYVPSWGTVERFDPLGYVAHMYDSVKLDAYLYDLFEKKGLTYMSSAESCPSLGIRKGPSHCTMFAIFYMHMRILYAADHLKQYPREKRTLFPLQFQRSLAEAIKHGTTSLTEYITNYAEMAVQSTAFVSSWNGYDESQPFWANTVLLIEELLLYISTGTTKQSKKKPEPAHPPSFFERMKQFVGGLFV